MRKSRDYKRVQSTGRRLKTEHLVVVFADSALGGCRFGITVSRKVGGAVVRNRVKRWLREALRHERGALSGSWDVVFIARPSAADAGFDVIRSEVLRALRGIR